MSVLYDHQRQIARKGKEILSQYGILYLAMQVRTGKTLTALSVCHLMGVRKVLFITRKGAISGVEADYGLIPFSYRLLVINYESLHKVPTGFESDIVIVDEAHNIGTYPKPSLRAKNIKKLCAGKPVIFLSGTPSPESYSQLFHQFWVSERSPWGGHKNFYAWAREYVNIRRMNFGGLQFNDYSQADRHKISEDIKKYVITLSQKEAGITQNVEENILSVPCPVEIDNYIKWLKRDRVVPYKDTAILGDTAVKLMSKIHQLSGGTFIDEDGNGHVVNDFKAQYIRERFDGQHIAIFYKFQAEGDLLKRVFPQWTSDPEVFYRKKTVTFIRQVVSGREGISLRTADALVMYSIDFSAVSYFQSIARIQDIRRSNPALLFWVFTLTPGTGTKTPGFEFDVYHAVSKKMDYTLAYFKKTYL